MQLQLNRARFRGPRLSRTLVEQAKGLLSDLVGREAEVYDKSVEFDLLEEDLETLVQTRVSEIMHYRAQIRYRLTDRD